MSIKLDPRIEEAIDGKKVSAVLHETKGSIGKLNPAEIVEVSALIMAAAIHMIRGLKLKRQAILLFLRELSEHCPDLVFTILKPNARLIAAAPELLEAAKAVLAEIKPAETPAEHLLEQAVAKADGRE